MISGKHFFVYQLFYLLSFDIVDTYPYLAILGNAVGNPGGRVEKIWIVSDSDSIRQVRYCIDGSYNCTRNGSLKCIKK